jgi:hypothetical protein
MSKIEQRILALVVLVLLGAILFQLAEIKSELERVDVSVTGVQVELERSRLRD